MWAVIGKALDETLSVEAPIELVCREVRAQGQRCLALKSHSVYLVTICEGASEKLPVCVSAEYVCNSVKQELDWPLRRASLGGLKTVKRL